MPDWVSNELKVTGGADSVRRFVEAVAGGDESGSHIAFCLSAIDPMPHEYEDGASYLESAEYQSLLSAHQALASEDERVAFIQANPGFASELMWESSGAPREDGWYAWRLQHWGTKWDTTAESVAEVVISDDGREAIYVFDTAVGGVEPAIATLAKRYPELSFDLVTDYEISDHSTRWRWRNGVSIDGL